MLMDFQPAILGQIPDRDALMDKAQIALGWARANGVKVVFVRVAFVQDDYDAIPHHHKAFGTVKQNGLLAEGNPAFDIDPALEVRTGDTVVRKTRFGAFSTTDLHALFGDESINTLVMGGISTAGVVLSTVREASDHDYLIFVLSDATADSDPEVRRPTSITYSAPPDQDRASYDSRSPPYPHVDLFNASTRHASRPRSR